MSANEAAVGDVEMAEPSCSDSDVDPSMHDFTSDGTQPEALTSMHVVKTPQVRAAQLAADCHEVRATIGMANIESRYPKDLHFLHQADTSGERNTTHAMLLLPTNEPRASRCLVWKSRSVFVLVPTRMYPSQANG